MNRFLFFIVVLVFLTVGVSSTFAQTSNPVSNGEPLCIADVGPGRPTLRRRQPAPATPATDVGSFNQKLVEEDKCRQEDSATASLNSQKSIRFEFEGLRALSQADMVRALRERGIGLPKSPMPSSEVLTKATTVIKELLEARGHFHATVDTRHDEPTGTLILLIDEGQRLSLAEIRFEGNRRFSSQELSSKLAEYLADYPKMQEGYDSDIFDYCLRSLANFTRSQGYLQATFGQPIKEIDGRGLVLIIPVNEGVIYRLGEIKIEGAETVAPEKVKAMLNLRQGDIANTEDIGKWLFEDLKKVYGEMGYIQFTVEPEPEFKVANGANEGVVDFKVTIDEGRQFRVQSIKFQGSNIPGEELMRLLRIRAGDIFNQRLFEEGIAQLNQSGHFELIDKDRDSDFRTNDEEALIDIVIKVNHNKNGEVEPRDSSLTRRQP